MIYYSSPFADDKNLGKAYNKYMKPLQSGDWMVFTDLDACFFEAAHVRIIEEYIEKYPEAGIFTGRTNRIHPLATAQLYHERPSGDFNFKHHSYTADKLAKGSREVTEITKEISGFLMVFSYDTWRAVGCFSESLQCLGVDNDFSLKVLNIKKIYCMDDVFVWHAYRIHDINDKEHLL